MEVLQAINKRLTELGAWQQRVLRDPSAKIASLNALHTKIKESELSSLDDIKGIIEQWEKEESTLEVNGKKVQNGTLMSMHRNLFSKLIVRIPTPKAPSYYTASRHYRILNIQWEALLHEQNALGLVICWKNQIATL